MTTTRSLGSSVSVRRQVDVAAVIDGSTNKRLPFTVATICFLMIVFDGLDSALFGTLLPIIMKDMLLGPAEAGALASIGHAGAVGGAVVFGMAADALGRKRMLLVGLALFTVFTAACGFAQGFADFAAYRFIAGIGLAGIVPIAAALVYEYTPGKRRALVSSVSYMGISAGVLLSAVLSMTFAAEVGWRALLVGTSVCIVLMPVAMLWLPESMSILVKRGDRDAIRRTLARVDPAFVGSAADEYVLNGPKQPKVPLGAVLRGEYLRNTLLLGVALFSLMSISVTLTTWIAHMMVQRGFALNTGITFILVFSCSNFLSTPLAGWMADRMGYRRVFALYMPLLFVSMSLIGVVSHPAVALACMFFAGFSVLGATCLLLPYAGSLYPPNIRSSAMGLVYAIGRIGPITGPAVTGLMLAAGLSVPSILIWMASPSVVVLVAFFLLKQAPLREGSQRYTHEALTPNTCD